jgi:hypothetical protein
VFVRIEEKRMNKEEVKAYGILVAAFVLGMLLAW